MSEKDRLDPLEALRRADPVRSSPAPSESKARVWARIQEVTMDNRQSAPRRRAAWAAALGGVAVAGVAAAVAALNSGATPTPSENPGTGIGSCVQTYSLDALANRDFAFDGTVAAIAGDQVTFTINDIFKGEHVAGGSVTLTATGMSGTSITSAGGPTLTVGERYLVAGDDEFVWACGFTQPYGEEVAADWAEAAR
jgi:hypothetical protein